MPGVKKLEKGQMQSCCKDDKIVAIDFTASWCGPCKMIGPKFEAMSNDAKYSKIEFVKIDVDDCEEEAAACGISAMPTFQIWQGDKKVDELVGASEEKLKALLDKYC